jgi:hypothetical protein
MQITSRCAAPSSGGGYGCGGCLSELSLFRRGNKSLHEWAELGCRFLPRGWRAICAVQIASHRAAPPSDGGSGVSANARHALIQK